MERYDMWMVQLRPLEANESGEISECAGSQFGKWSCGGLCFTVEEGNELVLAHNCFQLSSSSNNGAKRLATLLQMLRGFYIFPQGGGGVELNLQWFAITILQLLYLTKSITITLAWTPEQEYRTTTCRDFQLALFYGMFFIWYGPRTWTGSWGSEIYIMHHDW